MHSPYLLAERNMAPCLRHAQTWMTVRVADARSCQKASVAQVHGYAQVHICTRNFENGPEP